MKPVADLSVTKSDARSCLWRAAGHSGSGFDYTTPLLGLLVHSGPAPSVDLPAGGGGPFSGSWAGEPSRTLEANLLTRRAVAPRIDPKEPS